SSQLPAIPNTSGSSNSVAPASSSVSLSAKRPPTTGATPSIWDNLSTGTEEYNSAGASSIRGLKPENPNWINQDNFFIAENFDNNDFHVYCVLDGHGEFGHIVSRRCREFFPFLIRNTQYDIKKSFAMMQNDLVSSSDIDVRCSGATCV